MPLFMYQCENCEWVVEKFLHDRDDEIEIICEECEGENFQRIQGLTHSRMRYNAKDTFNKRISPEVERIRDNISKGKDKDFIDINGE